MSAEGEAGSNRRGEPRVPFDGAVRLRYRLFQEFLDENAANISAGGIFIRTMYPGEVGSELDFEIRLEDEFNLIQGRGEVVWVRAGGGAGAAEPGMGIRFVELPDESRALVDRIVGERVAAGLELFDLDGEAPAAGAPAGAPKVTVPEEGAAPIWELESAGAEPDAAGQAPEAGPAIEEPWPAAAPGDNLAALDPEMPAPIAAPGPPGPPGAADTVARPPTGAAGRPGVKSRPRPLRLFAVAVISALIGAGAVIAFYWLYVQPSIDALETRIDELAGRPGGPWQPPAAEPDEANADAVGEDGDEITSEEVAADAVPVGQSAEVVDALRGWAAAWTEQRVEDYFAYYATGFELPDGLDRPAWEAARRARIERPQWIRIALTLVQVEPGGPDSAAVGFVQSYRSERYEDLVRKQVLMVRQDGDWKIAAERALPEQG